MLIGRLAARRATNVQTEDGQLVLKLDTAKFRHGPTPFFELIKADRP